MLLHGAFDPGSRRVALLVAGASKLTFIGLVLAQGGRHFGFQAGVAAAVDGVMVLLLAKYLLTSGAVGAQIGRSGACRARIVAR
jgi:hypothetical protein